MKVSIVIPALNEEKVISKTLESLLTQTHPDFEVIVVDNASKDKTADVVSNFAKNIAGKHGSKIKVVRENRPGLLWARDRGRQEARGEIIANMDADCLPEASWMTDALKHFDNPKVVAVSGPYDYYDAHNSFRLASWIMQNLIYRPVGLILQLPFVRGGAVMIGGNNFIRAEVLNKMGGYNTSLTFYGEDTDTAKRVAKHGRIVFTPKITMKTSARRFRDEGTVKITAKYLYHFFKQIFTKQKA